ncbi:uncharacterized protein CMC5_056620 [Chondromyces crocatus]|uniref:Uncharacterized protein n=1 Tax=Chondromyces crocatus TaxID=52 RepID=A0A0K1EKP6_CHOCO|nr:uncharacterized protein CMC5_056620 [Chondromyces crocatus]
MAKWTNRDRTAHVGICFCPGVWGSSASLMRDILHIASVVSRARSGSGGIEARFLGVQPGDVPTADAGQPGGSGCRTEYSVPERKGIVIDANPWRGSRT